MFRNPTLFSRATQQSQANYSFDIKEMIRVIAYRKHVTCNRDVLSKAVLTCHSSPIKCFSLSGTF